MNPIRPRRLRRNSLIRELVAETRFSPEMLVYPIFVSKRGKEPVPVESMPGIHVFPVDRLPEEVEALLKAGINKLLVFGTGDPKATDASPAYDFRGALPTAVRRLKADFGKDIYVITDVCVCAYTTHGHCGILAGDDVVNDASVAVLTKMALTHAEAGADMVAPSDMMDGRVGAIREALDENGFEHTAIMSYAVKYASAYYGPFRDAAGSAPGKGDRKGYQMDVRNRREALREALLDEEEGADIIMVKPALAYLDIITQLAETSLLPVACYNVSGEYSMVKAAARNGWIDERSVVMENMTAFTRAGAGIIITYHAKDIVMKGWLPR